jgi:26S proteasome regulatory subunit N3
MVQSVRAGDLDRFQKVILDHSEVFTRDANFSLIQRLRHNVIKFGLKKINLSYSRISLEDIKSKLSLETISDTEYIVAKAIRDGVISARVDHSNQNIQSKETVDIYAQNEP